MARYIDPSVISAVKNSANIVDVVKDYLKLSLAGGLWVARCPFHQENTPSFKVSDVKGIYYCFGCNASGDSIAFVMEYEGVSFIEAVTILAEKYGINVVTSQKSKAEYSQQNKLAEINGDAKDLFIGAMSKAEIEYLSRRGITQNTIEKFSIGYAPDSWDFLVKNLSAKHTEINLLLSGVVKKKNNIYDFFRNRITVPIQDLKGNVLGFTARALNPSEKVKYINTSDTPLYTKGNHLFGLLQARDSIRKSRFAILTEGAFDAIVLHQYGIDNAIANLGTAFTENQCKLLKRVTSQVVICYDGDSAGMKAAVKTGTLLMCFGIASKILYLPDNLDPEDYIKKYGKKAFIQKRSKAKKFVDFLMEYYETQFDLSTPEGKSGAVKEVLDIIKLIEDDIQRREYFDIFMKKYNIHTSLHTKLWNTTKSLESKYYSEDFVEQEKTLPEAEKLLCKYLIEDQASSKLDLDSLCSKFETLPLLKKLQQDPDKLEVIKRIDNKTLKNELYSIYMESQPFGNITLDSCVTSVEKLNLQKKISLTQQKLESETDYIILIDLLAKQQLYVRQLNGLDQELEEKSLQD